MASTSSSTASCQGCPDRWFHASRPLSECTFVVLPGSFLVILGVLVHFTVPDADPAIPIICYAVGALAMGSGFVSACVSVCDDDGLFSFHDCPCDVFTLPCRTCMGKCTARCKQCCQRTTCWMWLTLAFFSSGILGLAVSLHLASDTAQMGGIIASTLAAAFGLFCLMMTCVTYGDRSLASRSTTQDSSV
jgi:uncharacterized membrane protein HdeD (DUF308 family)